MPPGSAFGKQGPFLGCRGASRHRLVTGLGLRHHFHGEIDRMVRIWVVVVVVVIVVVVVVTSIIRIIIITTPTPIQGLVATRVRTGGFGRISHPMSVAAVQR